MNDTENLLRNALSAIDTVSLKAKDLIQEAEALIPNRSREFSDLLARTNSIRSQIANPEPITIALLGDSGHGKSTLINAVIDKEILPTSGSKVCTAGIIRIKHSSRQDFKVTIVFTSQESWLAEVEDFVTQLKSDLESARENDHEDGKFRKSESKPDLRDLALRSRIEAVYGTRQFSTLLTTADISNLILPNIAQVAFAEGSRSFEEKSVVEIRRLLSKYIVIPDNKDETELEGQIWPLVDSVLVEGDFPAIAHGAELVDLPGLNDSNPAREKMTLDFLHSAKFIVIVFHPKREIPKGVEEILTSPIFMDKILESGKKDALTFVATHCDQLDMSDEMFEHLDSKASSEEYGEIRKSHAIEVTSRGLKVIAEKLASRYQTEIEKTNIRYAIIESRKVAVSAQDYLNLRRREQGKVTDQVRFTTLPATGIVTLREQLRDQVLLAGPRVLVLRIYNELLQVMNGLSLFNDLEITSIAMRNEANFEKFKVLGETIGQLTNELHMATRLFEEEFGEKLKKRSDFFLTQVLPKEELEISIYIDFRDEIKRLYWNTLRATLTRGGVFYSPTFGEINLFKRIWDPMLKSSLGPWTLYFEEILPELLDEIREGIGELAESYSVQMVGALEVSEENSVIQDSISSLVSKIETQTSGSLVSLKSSLKVELTAARSQLVDLITKSVQTEMLPFVLIASEERGTGMKGRMVHTLSEAAYASIPKIFENSRNSISNTVHESTERVSALIKEAVESLISETTEIVKLFQTDTPNANQDSLHKIQEFGLRLEESLSQAHRINFDRDNQGKVPLTKVASKISSGGNYLVVDGSNVATVNTPSGKKTDLDKLLNCKQALISQFPGHEVIMIVDARFRHIVFPSQLDKLNELLDAELINQSPRGVEADDMILGLVEKLGGRAVSNDNFEEWGKKYPWLKDSKRVLKYMTAAGVWNFTTKGR